MTTNTLIRELLRSPSTWDYNEESFRDSIMIYGKICNHNTGYMCECRIEELIKRLENEE